MRHVIDGELHDARFCAALGQCGKDGIADASLWVVVLDRDDPARRLRGAWGEGMNMKSVVIHEAEAGRILGSVLSPEEQRQMGDYVSRLLTSIGHGERT